MVRHPRSTISAVLAVGLTAMLGLTVSTEPPPAPTAHITATRQPARQAVKPKWVYLTFDDGPSARYTAQILKILQAYHVRATFFEVGQNVKRYPAVTRRVDQLGHSVQNHSWSHPNLTKVNWATFKYQVRTTDRYLRAQTGYTPRCLRPPYGATNRVVAKRAAMLGKKLTLWTADPADWSRPGTSVIVRRVLAKVRSGSVVLMHDGGGNRSQTVAALPKILKVLKARGYLFYPLWCH